MKALRIALKLIIALVSFILFVGCALLIFLYYQKGTEYLYHSQAVALKARTTLIILLILFVVFIVTVITMFAGKKAVRVICTVLLILSIPVSVYVGQAAFAVNLIFSGNGCSYTQDITNYGKYDPDVSSETSFFPDSITEDMTVVRFSYYYKYLDVDQIDLYLEIKFENADTMAQHLAAAKDKIKPNEIIEYQNPFDAGYTDVMIWKKYSWNDEWTLYHNLLSCESYDDDTKYVVFSYSCISYSFDKLTVIYNASSIGSDILIGSNPDNGDFYPAFLERFNVEWEEGYTFGTRKIINTQ